MLKWIKILFIKWKWVLFGKKTLKQTRYEIKKEKGVPTRPKTRFKVSNAHYASTKRTK